MPDIIFHTPAKPLEKSHQFYTDLGFKVLKHPTLHLIGDEKSIFELNPDHYARAGIKVFGSFWQDWIPKLENDYTILEKNDLKIAYSPAGCPIYMSKEQFDVKTPEGTQSLLGNFMGLSLECHELKRSMDFWQLLDFKISMGSVEKGWVLLMHEVGFGVSLMKPLSCPHLFFNPSISYFNGGKNPEIIQKIRDLKIPIAEELTVFNKENIVDNIILQDPGGYGFFIFND